MSETTGTMTSELAKELISHGEQAQRDRIAQLNQQLRVCTNQPEAISIQEQIAAAEEIIANLGEHISSLIGKSLFT